MHARRILFGGWFLLPTQSSNCAGPPNLLPVARAWPQLSERGGDSETRDPTSARAGHGSGGSSTAEFLPPVSLEQPSVALRGNFAGTTGGKCDIGLTTARPASARCAQGWAGPAAPKDLP